MPKQSHYQVYNLRKPLSQKDIYTPIFNTLFTISRPWKQPKCPSTDEWIKMWYVYIHTREYYSAIKRKIIRSSVVA